jgi:serine/threonine protein kinase/tetratricopeptide (TPR) repeat protein
MSEETLFHLALEQPAAERGAFLDKMCGDDVGLRQRVEALLHAHANPGDFLAPQPALPQGQTVDEPRLADRPGSRIGPYKLLQQIGEGGFGIVFMAEQHQPVHRRVALKIIKPGMDSAQVIARFEAERQALAMMDHQNIAKVYDAGTTDAARPYFVMELVHGVPITRYCDDNHLTVRERLELFMPVCKAIQHAHQKGIIHRDLKPSNVLVCLYDGQPVPKVIDFGVAKATEQRLTERTMFTQYGQIIGTLEYMSPEQAEMSQLGVDTRSDIYSLGVMLYELLTGSTPLQRQRLREAGLAEMLKMIKEEEPPKPSTRLSSAQESAKIAAARRTEPTKLAKLVRGELDWIVMKCLEKDRARRYDTANGLARDIERYLHDEAVEACPPSTGYRLRKLARKHRAAFTIAAAFLVLLMLAGALCAWQAVRATQAEGRALAERDRAEQEKDRAEAGFRMARDTVDRFFTQVGESPQLQAQGMEKFRKDLLQNAKEFYERFIREQSDAPAARHDLGLAHVRLAKIQQVLGDYREAETALEKAIALLSALSGEQPDVADYQRDLAVGYAAIGDIYRETSRFDKAEAAYQQALAIREKLAAAHPDTAAYHSALANTYFGLGLIHRQADRMEKATASFEQAQALQTRLVQEHPREAEYQIALAKTQTSLGFEYSRLDLTSKAEAVLKEALGVHERLLRDYPDVPDYQENLGLTRSTLGKVHHDAGQDAQAEVDFRQALEIYQKLAREHPDVPLHAARVGTCYNQLGVAEAMQGNLDAALASFDKAIEALERFLERQPRSPEQRTHLRNARITRACVLATRGDYARAVQEAEAIAAKEELNSSNLYNMVCLYSRCAAAAGKDAKLPPTERIMLREQYAVRAIEYFRQSVAKGIHNLSIIKTDSDLDALREREDFKKLVAEAEKKIKGEK